MSRRCAIIRPKPEGRQWEKEEPLGSEAICGYLRANGIECRVFDRRVPFGDDLRADITEFAACDRLVPTLREFICRVQEYNPDVIGFSLMTQEDIPDALRLFSRLKRPDRVFFAGGLFVTTEIHRCSALFPDQVFLIPGEGEGPVLSLVRDINPVMGRLRSHVIFDEAVSAAGSSAVRTWIRSAEGHLCSAGLSNSRVNPNDWAYPSRDDLPSYLAEGGVIHLRSARGCRGGCRFCTTPALSHGRHEERDIQLVADEMAALAAQGYPPIFNFTDDEFGDLKRIERLIRELARRNIKAAFSLELRPAVMCTGSSEIWKQLHEGGLCRVFTGLENLAPDTLRRWGKAGDPLRLIAAVKQCKEAGILCETGYILFHRGSTVDSVRNQVQALYRHGLFTPKAALSRMVLYPGSALHAESGKQGVALEKLQPDIQRLYDLLGKALEGLYEAWTACSVKLPNAACRAFLTGDDRTQKELEKNVSRINEESYGVMTDILKSWECLP